MKKIIFCFIALCSFVDANVLEDFHSESTLSVSDKKAINALRLAYSKNFGLTPEDVILTTVSWNMMYGSLFNPSIGMGYRKMFGDYAFGIHKFLDVSRINGEFIPQSGLTLEVFRWPYEMKFNANVPWVSQKKAKKFDVKFHRMYELATSVYPSRNVKLSIIPIYCGTKGSYGAKAGVRWFFHRNASAEILFGYDPLSKRTAALSFHLGASPNDFSTLAPVQRNFYVAYEKIKHEKPSILEIKAPESSIIPKTVEAVKPNRSVNGFDFTSFVDQDAVDKDGKKKVPDPFFLWKLLGLE